MPPPDQLTGIDWAMYETRVMATAGKPEHRTLRAILARYQARHPGQGVAAFAPFLADAAASLVCVTALSWACIRGAQQC
jgi:hypothetical protein